MWVCLYHYVCMITIVLLFFSIGIANVSFHWSDSSLALLPLSYTPLPTRSAHHHVKPKTFKEDIRWREDREQGEEPGEEQETMTEPQCTTQESAVAHTHSRTIGKCLWTQERMWMVFWTHQLAQLKLHVEKGSKHITDPVNCLLTHPLCQLCALLQARNS